MAELSRESEVEAQAMNEAYALFEQRKPRPLRPGQRLLAMLGWEFWLMMVTAIAATVLTALRTGTAFFVAAVGQFSEGAAAAIAMGEGGGYAEAAAAILAIEGLLLGIGAMDGQRRYHKALSSARIEGKHLNEVIFELNQKFKWISVGLALLTSIMAGGAVSANIIPTLDPGVKQTLFMILSILMAFASVLAFTTGEMLGMMNEEARAKVELLRINYQAEIKAWEEEREAFWRANRMSYMGRLDRDLVVEIQKRKRAVSAAAPPPQATGRREIGTPQAAEVLAWWLKKHGMSVYDDSISSKTIAEEAMREAYKGTNMQADPQEINTLAASIRMALSRERKKASPNGNGQTTAEID